MKALPIYNSLLLVFNSFLFASNTLDEYHWRSWINLLGILCSFGTFYFIGKVNNLKKTLNDVYNVGV